MTIKVGTIKLWRMRPNGKQAAVEYTYSDVKYDPDGWADAEKFMPLEYDLVFVKTEAGKTVSAWHTGHAWDGLKLKKDDKVLYWKRKPDEKE